MKTTLLLFLCFFSIQSVSAQYTASELKLKTGETLRVLGKIKGSDEFKYKKYAKDKPKRIHFSEIEYVKLLQSKNDILTYKYFRIAGKDKPRVMQEMIVGDVSLYVISARGILMTQSGFLMMNTYTSVSYYVKRPHNTEVILLEEPESSGKRFRRVATTFFADCNALVQKIKNKELKARHTVAIVKYYNEECN